jgi:hypothetical protein
VGVLCAVLAWQPYPACVDYPQHLALAGQVRDLLEGQGRGRLVLLTYNGLFELVTGVTALLLPLEVSGRLVLAAIVAVTALSVWRSVVFCGRPRSHAFAWLPLAYSLPLSWGFLNLSLSAALATIALVYWYEQRSRWGFVLLSLLTAMAHVLGAMVLVAGVLLGVLVRKRPANAALQVVPLVGWVALAHARTDPAPHLPWAEQVFFPPWAARLRLSDTLLGSWHGPEDEWLAAIVAAAFVGALLMGIAQAFVSRRYPWREPFFWLVVSAVAVYAAGPLALLGCWFFYQRFGTLLTLWLPAIMPALPQGRWRAAQALVLVTTGTLATLNFASHAARLGEVSDAQSIIDAVPVGARVASVLALAEGERLSDTLRGLPATDALVWAHLPAYAVALRGAETTWMFAREHGHFAVRLPALEQLDMPQVDYSWSRAYHPDAPYASVFAHVLVLTGRSDPTRDPRTSVFGEASAAARVIAHHGRFWLFEYARPAP